MPYVYRAPREADSPINLVLPLAIIVGGLYAWKEGWLDDIINTYKEKGQAAIDNFKKNAPEIDLTPPGLRGGGGGGAGLVYRGTGKVMANAKQRGPTVRHYASGAPNDTTTEWNIENCPFTAYEFDADVSISKIDHDDSISMKMWGPHHQDGKGAWYINDLTLKSGSFEGGWEQPHPHTVKCVKGGSIGSIVGKTTHVKSIIWPITGGGAHVEFYANGQKMYAGNRPCGKSFSRDSNQQIQLRIDAAPGVRATNVRASEIVVPSVGGAAFTQPVDMNDVRAFQTLYA
jgi:hypothetical protein